MATEGQRQDRAVSQDRPGHPGRAASPAGRHRRRVKYQSQMASPAGRRRRVLCQSQVDSPAGRCRRVLHQNQMASPAGRRRRRVKYQSRVASPAGRCHQEMPGRGRAANPDQQAIQSRQARRGQMKG